MRNKMRSIKNHFDRNRFKYGVATGLGLSGYFIVKRAEEWNEFLTEHNLLDEFYEMSEV